MEFTGNDIVATPASVMTRAVLDVAMLMNRVRDIVPDPSVLTELDPYFWSAEISSDRMDSYYTRMSESTLRNYRDDAVSGVSFQNSHRTNELGLGRSLDAQFIGSQGNGVSRVEVTFYTLRGLRLNDISTDDLIRGIRGGIVKDVSVGFYGGRYICSICGRDMLKDWDCSHIPGMKYTRVDPVSGRSDEDQMCWAWVDGARLAEVSAVYEGSTPGAAILKAVREAESGRLTNFARSTIEQRYRCSLPQKNGLFLGADGRPLAPTRAVDSNTQTTEELSVENQAKTNKTAVEVENPVVVEVEPETTTETSSEVNVESKGDVTSEEMREVVTETIQTASDDVAVEDAPNEAPDQPEDSQDRQVEVADTNNSEVENETGDVEMGNENAQPDVETTRALAELSTIRQLVNSDQAEVGVRTLAETVRSLKERVDALEPFQAEATRLKEENERLAPLADMGRQYRAALIEEAIAEGVRADGSSFPADTYKVLLENADVDHIKSLRDGFRIRGDAQLSGGRKTHDTTETVEVEEKQPVEENRAKTREIPAAAYRV